MYWVKVFVSVTAITTHTLPHSTTTTSTGSRALSTSGAPTHLTWAKTLLTGSDQISEDGKQASTEVIYVYTSSSRSKPVGLGPLHCDHDYLGVPLDHHYTTQGWVLHPFSFPHACLRIGRNIYLCVFMCVFRCMFFSCSSCSCFALDCLVIKVIVKVTSYIIPLNLH